MAGVCATDTAAMQATQWSLVGREGICTNLMERNKEKHRERARSRKELKKGVCLLLPVTLEILGRDLVLYSQVKI